jgi:hypothetical protein
LPRLFNRPWALVPALEITGSTGAFHTDRALSPDRSALPWKQANIWTGFDFPHRISVEVTDRGAAIKG